MTEATTKKTRRPNPLTAILNEVKEAVKDQDAPLPLWGGKNPDAGRNYFADQESRWNAINAERAEAGTLGADGLLLEDVFGAISQTDKSEVRLALVLLAAQAVAAVAQLDRGEG
ncbi:hypothetical protein SEA_VERSE_41 [Streptomyces phage Verse]|uniref:Uncharacterized protein n=2 Tax=Streptomyces phage Amela TaxID=1673877 RepID=A0A0K1Y9L7_9CAUD|nr:hypothetical protein AVT29_gp41 [Streptomyces phage Amela]AKY03796.1 hypothetical protein SEA_AMELA_41 [Streptomyces phage Amela]AKY03871.1 hypothetical protein SEA_VERSE_41 [Streptomyces phage Verse]